MRLCILLFFTANILSAQKVVKKSIINPTIKNIQIDGSNCFEIKIETNDSNEMVVEAIIDGEYKKDLIINTTEKGATLFISGEFERSFKNPNDKLSAHKVVSIALYIKLPKQKSVNVFGTSCNVITVGDYQKLSVTLNDGTCYFDNISGVIEAITQSGDIIVKSKAANVNAVSKYGVVKNESIPSGENQFKLNTITGDIRIKKIE